MRFDELFDGGEKPRLGEQRRGCSRYYEHQKGRRAGGSDPPSICPRFRSLVLGTLQRLVSPHPRYPSQRRHLLMRLQAASNLRSSDRRPRSSIRLLITAVHFIRCLLVYNRARARGVWRPPLNANPNCYACKHRGRFHSSLISRRETRLAARSCLPRAFTVERVSASRASARVVYGGASVQI